MSGKRAKRMRRMVKKVLAGDITEAWNSMLNCRTWPRVRLAWRLALGKNMDGTRRSNHGAV